MNVFGICTSGFGVASRADFVILVVELNDNREELPGLTSIADLLKPILVVQ
jgi:hypothetical protein